VTKNSDTVDKVVSMAFVVGEKRIVAFLEVEVGRVALLEETGHDQTARTRRSRNVQIYSPPREEDMAILLLL
jgi:hypothetical protein